MLIEEKVIKSHLLDLIKNVLINILKNYYYYYFIIIINITICLYFQAFNHAYSNEDLLKSKVQSMIECFLESVTPPTLQASISLNIKH